MFFTVHEWRGGNDSRAPFIALNHIIAVSDDLDSNQYPDTLKTYILLSTGDRCVTLEPLGELITRLKLASLKHDSEHPGELTAQNAKLPIDSCREDQGRPAV